MIDHLEPYRRMARSIRFFPPASLTNLSQESIAGSLMPAPVVTSSPKYTTTQADASLEIGPPIDPSKHAAALVHEAVCKRTVLPASYGILENIGDRISRLTTPKPVEAVIIQPKIPQPTEEGTSTQVSPPLESAIDPEHAAILVHEAVSKPTVLPESYTILEDIGDRISRLTTPGSVDSDIIQPEIPQPDSNTTSVQTIEPQPREADLKKSLDDPPLEASVSSTVGAEVPTVEETPSDDAVGVVVEPLEVEETTENQVSAVVVEPVAVEEPTDDKGAAAVVTQPAEVEETPSDEPVTVVTESTEVEETSSDELVAETEEAQAPTLLEKVSSVIEAVATVFKHPEADQKDSETVVAPSESDIAATEAPAADTAEPMTTEAPAAEAEETQAPTLLEQVSSVIEAVATVFKQQEIEPKDSEAVVEPFASEPTATEATAVDPVESLTTEAPDSDVQKAQAPMLLEQDCSVVETVATPLKESEADKKNSEAVVESAPATAEKASDKKTVDITCPKCESTDIRKNGRRQGKQRYVCKDCGRDFVISSSAQAEDKPKSQASSPVETAKVKGTKSSTGSGDRTAESSKSQSKKKAKAKGFGDSKKNK